MKEPNWKNCTEKEMWQYVAHHLAKNGIDTILVGGAVVAIYTDGAYRSGDLDLVMVSLLRERLPEVMAKIGFNKSESRHYSHPKCKHLIIDFASPPAAIGDDYTIKPAEVKVDGEIIFFFQAEDCIRDRLASFIHFKARECLDQAVMVAQAHPFDLKKVKSWCLTEGGKGELEEFLKKLGKS